MEKVDGASYKDTYLQLTRASNAEIESYKQDQEKKRVDAYVAWASLWLPPLISLFFVTYRILQTS